VRHHVTVQTDGRRPPHNESRMTCGAVLVRRTARPGVIAGSLADNITLPLKRGAVSSMRWLGRQP
jgi:hypothetical protein